MVTSQQHLTRQPMTVEQWADLPEDVAGELVHGHLEEEEMPGAGHEVTVIFLGAAFRDWLGSGGATLGSGVKYALAPDRGRMPDLSVFLPGSRLPPRSGAVYHPPDIAVEVVSDRPADRRLDRVAKLAEYARFGIRSYWLVDPEARILEILELDEEGLYRLVLSADSGTVTVPGCEGLTLDLDALWSELDRLEP